MSLNILPVAFILGSLSIMDMSIEAEQKINVNHVPDYIEDIYKYLREMEVRTEYANIIVRRELSSWTLNM